MVVVLLLITIWAAVLVPPALQAHAARRDAFLVSFGPGSPAGHPPPARPGSSSVRRRRRILGGLLMAMAATGLLGLLPAFRVLLVVHLFLVDSFLAYVALLAHLADRRSRATAALPAPAPARARWAGARRVLARPGLLGELPPVAPAG
jgi:hypothetical protein